MKIKFCDLNKSLVSKVSALGIESVHADYFLEAYKTPFSVLMTASNPMFTFGGGLDYHFTKHFPKICEYKRMKGGENERIANICFTITVNDELVATRESITKAIWFAIASTEPHETLVLSGVGTGIGGLSEDEFIEILKELTNVQHKREVREDAVDQRITAEENK